MAKIQYQKLNILVADDFSNFRSTVSKMLMDLGVVNIDMASNSEEILDQCSKSNYDVILCDYNLGAGRNGQHVLEELRHKNYLSRRGLFVLVSAEASRNIVMCAYDSAPDDYLMKPITAKMLNNRLDRLLQLRHIFVPVHTALEKNDHHTAMDILIDLSIAEDRYSTAAQKLLGDMFLKYGEYNKAEKLYMRVLEVRELDWARLGLAKAKHLQGDLEQAGKWLTKIVEDNYLYLPAYDALADNWLLQGQIEEAQSTVQMSVDVSPMSILRQKNLATLAMRNNDAKTAVDALRKVVKLGKLSCHGTTEDNLNLARAISSAIENKCELPISIINETLNVIENISSEPGKLSSQQAAQILYLHSRLHSVKGNTDKGKELLVNAEIALVVEDSNIDIEIDHIRALLALDYRQKMNDLLSRLQELYTDDQEALERLDEFLDEPASDANKAIVADVNREGIDLYNNGAYDQALACFDRAVQLFPKHIGLQLNIVQALIGKLKSNPDDLKSREECRQSLESIAVNIDQSNSQYKRFIQLKNMARGFYESV